MGSPRVAIHVQHLQGSGHLVRALALARALVNAGMVVQVFSGGDASYQQNLKGAHTGHTNQVDLIQLPSLHCKPGDFTDLRDEYDMPITDTWRAHRVQATLQALEAFKPDLFITELFPFGRRQLRFELIPALDYLRNSDTDIPILCSVRDVLQRRKPRREEETLELLNTYFSAVLVHGDDRFLPLSNTFQKASAIRIPIIYTGYIHAYQSPNSTLGSSEASSLANDVRGVVVSAGSSSAGLALLQSAIRAKPLSQLAEHPWLIRVGHGVSDSDFNQLCAQADSATTVERNQPDFLSTLRQYAVSVSLSGYNTCLDLLLANNRCVLVPFEGQGESEQLDRANALSHLSHFEVLYENRLNAETLTKAIDHVAVQPVEAIDLPNCDGLTGSVNAVKQLLDASA